MARPVFTACFLSLAMAACTTTANEANSSLDNPPGETEPIARDQPTESPTTENPPTRTDSGSESALPLNKETDDKKADEADKKRRDDIDNYIRSLKEIKTDPSSTSYGPPSEALEGDQSCHSQRVKETKEFDKIIAYAANSDSLWPGAAVHGNSIESGLLGQIGLDSNPLTVSVSLESLKGTPGFKLDTPSLFDYRKGLNGILAGELSGNNSARISFEKEEIYSSDQLAIKLGANASWGTTASIAGSFDWTSKHKKTRLLATFTQAYYTADLNVPRRPSDFFGKAELADVKSALERDNNTAPAYVSSITYGRMVIFAIESDYSSTELKAALEASYKSASTDAKASTNDTATYENIVSSSKISAFVFGGSAEQAAQVKTYADLVKFVNDGGNYSKQSPGAPIAYKLNYMRDNSPVRLSLTADYQKKDCELVSKKVQVTLKSIKVNYEGPGEPGSALELYGHIYVQGVTQSCTSTVGATPIDVDGDHLADYCLRGVSGISCKLANGKPWPTLGSYSDAGGWNQAWYDSTIRFADINGDGKTDVCGRGADGLWCAVSTGDGFKNAERWTTDYRDAAGWNQARYYSTIRFPDINLDGKADVCGLSSWGLWCNLSTGTGFDSGRIWSKDNYIEGQDYSTIGLPNKLNCENVVKETDLLYTDPSSAISISRGESYPQPHDFIKQEVIDVIPKKGQTIKLVVHLMDYDTGSADDLIGDFEIDAPFDTGWDTENKAPLKALLTGDEANVEVLFELKPVDVQ